MQAAEATDTVRLDPSVAALVRQLREARRALRAVCRHLGVERPKPPRDSDGAWRDRIRFLRALYQERGNVVRACRASKVKRGKAYYHQNASQLFADCWEYVRAYVLAYSNADPWSKVWPAALDDIDILELAGVEEPIKPRLVLAGVLAPHGQTEGG